MTTYLIPRGVLDLVKRVHIMVIGDGHIEVCKHLSLITVQVGGISQLQGTQARRGEGRPA